ncbi:hypothetical protein P7K49_007469, partial [Saguinus oedipus]
CCLLMLTRSGVKPQPFCYPQRQEHRIIVNQLLETVQVKHRAPCLSSSPSCAMCPSRGLVCFGRQADALPVLRSELRREVSGDLKSWVAAFTLALPCQLILLPPTHWTVLRAQRFLKEGVPTSHAPTPHQPGPLEEPACLEISGSAFS